MKRCDTTNLNKKSAGQNRWQERLRGNAHDVATTPMVGMDPGQGGAEGVVKIVVGERREDRRGQEASQMEDESSHGSRTDRMPKRRRGAVSEKKSESKRRRRSCKVELRGTTDLAGTPDSLRCHCIFLYCILI